MQTDDVEVFEDLTQYDETFDPTAVGQRRPGLDSIPDGTYDWTILTAKREMTSRTNERILRLELRNETTGQVVDLHYYFRTQQAVNRLGQDLATLGFDVANWTVANDRPVHVELPRAVADLPGRRFVGKKVTRPNKKAPDKPYHNLDIAKPLDRATVAAGSNGSEIPR
jgi:hypothetical protein